MTLAFASEIPHIRYSLNLEGGWIYTSTNTCIIKFRQLCSYIACIYDTNIGNITYIRIPNMSGDKCSHIMFNDAKHELMYDGMYVQYSVRIHLRMSQCRIIYF